MSKLTKEDTEERLWAQALEAADENAFPNAVMEDCDQMSHGLSKYEWLCGIALQGILSNPETGSQHEKDIARRADECAWELLKRISDK